MANKFRYGVNNDRFGVQYGSRAKHSSGKRPKIGLGKVPESFVDDFVERVEALEDASQHGRTLAREMLGWLAGISDDIHSKLAKAFPSHVASRTPPESVPDVLLRDFLDEYIRARTDLNAATLDHFHLAKRELLSHYGDAVAIGELKSADGDQFRIHLSQAEKLA